VRIARAAAYCGSLGDDKNTACRIGDDIKHYLGDDNCALNKIGILSGSCVSTWACAYYNASYRKLSIPTGLVRPKFSILFTFS